MAAQLSAPDNHTIVLAGHTNIKQQPLKEFFNSAFKDNKVSAHLAAELTKEDEFIHSILVVGRNTGEAAIERAKKMKATLVKPEWAEEVFKSNSWISPGSEHIWRSSSGNDAEGDTEMGNTPGNSKTDKGSDDTSGKDKDKEDGSAKEKDKEDGSSKDKDKEDGSAKEKDKEDGSSKDKDKEDGSAKEKDKEDGSAKDKNKDDSSEKDKEDGSGKVKEEDSERGIDSSVPPRPTGPNSFEMDPIRRAWYDRVSGGPWTIVVGIHPADRISGTSTPRMNYTMCIEGIYMNSFVVTDPKTPIFVEYQQLRDSFLVPCWAYPSLKEQYIKAGGNQFFRRTAESLLGQNIGEFEFWSVSYDGRVCMVVGKVPTDNLPGIWSRSDLRKAWGTPVADGILNMIRTSMNHPWMEKAGRRKGANSESIAMLKLILEKKGPSVEIDLTQKINEMRI